MNWILAFLLSASATPNKTSCTARELRGQDCRLSVGTYKVRLLSETVARDDGTWHTVDLMPLKGEGVLWERANFQITHGQPLLQFWLWDKGAGESPVQSLHWYVADAHRGSLKVLAEGIVRRRRLKPKPDADGDAKVPSYIYDGWEKHSVQVLKGGKIEWSLGSHKKIINAAKEQAHGI